jgi:uncharacterized surface protein with fasciclin (FAS1) repeats
LLIEELETNVMPGSLTLIDTAIRSGTLLTFTRLVEGSHLERLLRSDGPYTILAPADIAFAYINEETRYRLLEAEGFGILSNMLSHHAVHGKFMIEQLRGMSRLKSLYGETLTICNEAELRVDGARLIDTDLEARNGVIHTIDRLLLPDEPASQKSSAA